MLSSRAVKILLYLWIIAWGFDRAIFWATEAAWFGSVGQSAWFGARFGAQLGLFWCTFALALASAALAMRVAVRPVAGSELRKLPPVLERLEAPRRVATRIAWLVLLVGAWIVARQIAGGWATWLGARAGYLFDPMFGLPLARLIFNALWEWSLFLLGALAFAGVLRALPMLAAREPSPPLRLWRALGVAGALVLLTRGALYGLSCAEAYWSDGTTGAEIFIGIPLATIGIALCLLAAFWSLKRPGTKKLGIAVALALFAPHLLRVLLAPLSLVVPTPASVAARNRAETLDSWRLNEGPTILKSAPPLASHWPIWNESALLGLALGEHTRNAQHVIDWKRATIGPREAVVAGVPAGLENFGSPHEADADNGVEWMAFDATKNVDGAAPVLPDAALPLMSFYGLDGRALLGDNTTDAGVPFGFWGWKFAWAWRLRDPLLMLEGARAQRLLVYRGARESAERLAPFLKWDEPQLRQSPADSRWEMVGYASTPYHRGALAASEGAFERQNYVVPVLVLQIDPRNGRVTFKRVTFQSVAPTIYSEILGASPGATPKTRPLLDEARAQMARRLKQGEVLNEPVWTWTYQGAQKVSYTRRMPAGIEQKLALLDSAARRELPRDDNTELEMGDALLWPDARAPGGYWVGRPYYSMTKTAGATTNGNLARSAKLWRVSLTGLANSPLAHGSDAAAALTNFDLQNAPPIAARPAPNQTPAPGIKSQPPSKKELALQALQAHDAAQKAASTSQWDEWATQSARERELLQKLYQMPN